MEDPAVSLETFGDDGSRVLVERVQPRGQPNWRDSYRLANE